MKVYVIYETFDYGKDLLEITLDEDYAKSYIEERKGDWDRGQFSIEKEEITFVYEN